VGQLRVGDWVFARNHPISNAADNFNAGLAPKWKGPFKVKLVHGTDVYSLHRPRADDMRLHVNELKRIPPALREDAATASADPDSTLKDAYQPTTSLPPVRRTSPIAASQVPRRGTTHR
jgi:hypothetical protein